MPSSHSVSEIVEKLKGILQAKGITLFVLMDHSGEAERVGIKMPPTKLLIFGSPKSGTPLMLASPSSAIDLPLKILVWEDAQGKAWVTTAPPTSRSGTAYLRSWCKTSPPLRRWQPKLRSSSFLPLRPDLRNGCRESNEIGLP